MRNDSLGEKLKQEGMDRAEANANKRVANWSVSAFGILKTFIGKNKQFMAEDVREYAKKIGFEEPPSNRAWGAIIVKARKQGLIEMVGYNQVKNAKAHRANASVWRVKNENNL